MLPAPRTRWLLDLPDDVLVLVLLARPPGEQYSDVLFVALACQRLLAAARAAVAALEQEAARRALGWTGSACSDAHAPRLLTSLRGIVIAPRRFSMCQEICNSRGLFDMLVPPRARAIFLNAAMPQHGPYVDSLAAYRLRPRLLRAFVAHAPMHMIRASFFEVFSPSRPSQLDVAALRHHRALLLFAAAHGRVDVLDYLVHSQPSHGKPRGAFMGSCWSRMDHRVDAYDRVGGFLDLFTRRALSMFNGAAVPQTLICTEFGELATLVLKPAVRHGQHAVLSWMRQTVHILSVRAGVRLPALAVTAGTVLMTVQSSLSFSNSRRAFGGLVADACLCGNVGVLEQTAESAVRAWDMARAGCDDPETFWVSGFFWSFLVLVINSRAGVGKTIRWVIKFMQLHAPLLKDMAHRSCGIHLAGDGFVLEDLIAVLDGHSIASPGASSNVVMELFVTIAKRNELRGSLFVPGDPEYTRWLLGEFQDAEWRERSSPCVEIAVDSVTQRGWLGRTIQACPDEVSPLFLMPEARRVALVCRFLLLTTFYALNREAPALSALSVATDRGAETLLFPNERTEAIGWRQETPLQKSIGLTVECWVESVLSCGKETLGLHSTRLPSEWAEAALTAPISVARALCRLVDAELTCPASSERASRARRLLGRLFAIHLREIQLARSTNAWRKNCDTLALLDSAISMVVDTARRFALLEDDFVERATWNAPRLNSTLKHSVADEWGACRVAQCASLIL